MPKIKSSKTVMKRCIIRQGGKKGNRIKVGKIGNQHNAFSGSDRKKAKPSMSPLNHTKVRSVKHLLPYGGL